MVRDEQLRRVVVGDDGTLEAQLAAQEVVEDFLRSTARQTVDRRVRVHDRRESGVADGGAERFGVDLAQLARAKMHRGVIESALRHRVTEEVLAGRGDAVCEIALNASD